MSEFRCLLTCNHPVHADYGSLRAHLESQHPQVVAQLPVSPNTLMSDLSGTRTSHAVGHLESLLDLAGAWSLDTLGPARFLLQSCDAELFRALCGLLEYDANTSARCWSGLLAKRAHFKSLFGDFK